MLRTCNYASCMEEIGDNGITVSLKQNEYGDKVAGYCCVSHAVAALTRLAADRQETVPETPKTWKVT